MKKFLVALALMLGGNAAWADSNAGAIEQCGRITDWDIADRCQREASQHAYFSGEAVSQCGRISDNEWLGQCIIWIGGYTFNNRALSECGRVSDNELLARCIGRIRGATYFHDAAVEECGRITSNEWLTYCMGSIRDRWYSETDISWCHRAPSNDGLARCLATRGQPYAPGPNP